jgi:hypothetical protein
MSATCRSEGISASRRGWSEHVSGSRSAIRIKSGARLHAVQSTDTVSSTSCSTPFRWTFSATGYSDTTTAGASYPAVHAGAERVCSPTRTVWSTAQLANSTSLWAYAVFASAARCSTALQYHDVGPERISSGRSFNSLLLGGTEDPELLCEVSDSF